jgi:hypothetical protein
MWPSDQFEFETPDLHASGAQLLFHQQNYAQLCLNAQEECTKNFYTVFCDMCQRNHRKSTGTKAAHKMLMNLTPKTPAQVYCHELNMKPKYFYAMTEDLIYKSNKSASKKLNPFL